jgi:hypothetical protein
MRYLSVVLVLFALLLFSCRKDSINASGLKFSKDTIFFDTTFTTIGSSTEVFLVRNPSSTDLILDKVYLGGGNSSKFRLNVDGQPGNVQTDVLVPANDSIYVFVEVTINPNGSNAQLLESDSVVFEAAGVSSSVQLIAFGRDAHYIFPNKTLVFSSGNTIQYSVVCDQTWTPGKPYVIFGYAVVDENCKLTVQAGTEVHLFKNSTLWVYQGGTLQVLGELGNPVSFSGTRLNLAYQNDPGQWDRILINDGSKDNIIRHADIRNGSIGIQTVPLNPIDPKPDRNLVLENVYIRNMSGIGILAQNYNIQASNVLVGNCGSYGCALLFGGNYLFQQSTLANYWSRNNRQNPNLLLSNAAEFDTGTGSVIYVNDLTARFDNSVIHGSIQNELGFDTVSGAAVNFRFRNCLLKMDKDYKTGSQYVNILKNVDPGFPGYWWGDLSPGENSVIRNAGDPSVVYSNQSKLLFDARGTNRLTDNTPDLGALEYK